MKRALVLAAVLAATLTACGDKSERDEGVWKEAEDYAGLYCTMNGSIPPGGSLYSDEYLRCVEEWTKIEYKERMAEKG